MISWVSLISKGRSKLRLSGNNNNITKRDERTESNCLINWNRNNNLWWYKKTPTLMGGGGGLSHDNDSGTKKNMIILS